MKVTSLSSLYNNSELFRKKAQDFKPIKTLVVKSNPNDFHSNNFKEVGPLKTMGIDELRAHARRVATQRAEKELLGEISFKRRRRIELVLQSLGRFREKKSIENNLQKHDLEVASRKSRELKELLSVMVENREASRTRAVKAFEAQRELKETLNEIDTQRKEQRKLSENKLIDRREVNREAVAEEKEKKYQLRKHALIQELDRLRHRKNVMNQEWQSREVQKEIWDQTSARLSQRRSLHEQASAQSVAMAAAKENNNTYSPIANKSVRPEFTKRPNFLNENFMQGNISTSYEKDLPKKQKQMTRPRLTHNEVVKTPTTFQGIKLDRPVIDNHRLTTLRDEAYKRSSLLANRSHNTETAAADSVTWSHQDLEAPLRKAEPPSEVPKEATSLRRLSAGESIPGIESKKSTLKRAS